MLLREEVDFLGNKEKYIDLRRNLGAGEKTDGNSRPCKTIEVTDVSNENNNINEMHFHTNREFRNQSYEEIGLISQEKEESVTSKAGNIKNISKINNIKCGFPIFIFFRILK